MSHPRRRKEEPTAREMAASILSAVDSRAAFSDRLLTSYMAKTELSSQDRSLLTHLVKGTLRWRGRVDWVLSSVLKTELEKLPVWIRNVLRLGAYQILFMDRIPASAAVNESVKLARARGHPGTAGLVNAVLRRLTSVAGSIEYPDVEKAPIEAIAIMYSHPEWMVRRWVARFGKERTVRICAANNALDHMFVRPNALQTSRSALVGMFAEQGIHAEPGSINPEMIKVEGELAPAIDPLFQKGLYTVQDEAESLVCHMLSPGAGHAVLDLCAGPGGKATQLAEMMSDRGNVFCLEVHVARARQVSLAATRLGLCSMRVVAGDARLAPFKAGFQRILLDAPCSGLGVIGKRADARWRKKEESLQMLSGLQLELLHSASKLLDKDGVLVYSVCSFEPEETNDVVSSFLNEHRKFEVEKVSGIPGDVPSDERGAMMILPDQWGTDGMFAIRLKKVS